MQAFLTSNTNLMREKTIANSHASRAMSSNRFRTPATAWPCAGRHLQATSQSLPLVDIASLLGSGQRIAGLGWPLATTGWWPVGLAGAARLVDVDPARKAAGPSALLGHLFRLGALLGSDDAGHPTGTLGQLPGAGGLALYLGIYLPLFVAVARVAHHRWRFSLLIAAPVAWVGVEVARGYGPLGFSMALLGPHPGDAAGPDSDRRSVWALYGQFRGHVRGRLRVRMLPLTSPLVLVACRCRRWWCVTLVLAYGQLSTHAGATTEQASTPARGIDPRFDRHGVR